MPTLCSIDLTFPRASAEQGGVIHRCSCLGRRLSTGRRWPVSSITNMVLGQQPIEQFYTSDRRYGPALSLTVGVKAMPESDVIPAIRCNRCGINLDVKLAEAVNIFVALDIRVVHQVIELGQAEFSALHYLLTVGVKRSPGGLEPIR